MCVGSSMSLYTTSVSSFFPVMVLFVTPIDPTLVMCPNRCCFSRETSTCVYTHCCVCVSGCTHTPQIVTWKSHLQHKREREAHRRTKEILLGREDEFRKLKDSEFSLGVCFL